MKILVTGGTGMLGRSIVERYHKTFDISFTGRNISVGHGIERETGAKFVPVSLHQKEVLNNALKGVEGVIHCAALSSPWGSEKAFKEANVLGTQNLLKAALDNNVNRFVHVSSPSVYFSYQDEHFIDENKTLGPEFCNLYAKSKAEAESCVKHSELHTTILRPRGIIGPHDQAILPRIIQKASKGRFVLPSRNNPVIDLTYVDNVSDAAVLALTAKIASGEVYNITNGEPRNIESILECLFSKLGQTVDIKRVPYALISPFIRGVEALCYRLPGKPEPKFTRYSLALLHYNLTLNIEKAKNELGYQPKVSIEEGIDRYVRWYRSTAF